MKKLLIFICAFLLSICMIGCDSNVSTSNANTPEDVAALAIESWFEHDFKSYLSTYPSFRLRYRAVSYCSDSSADLSTVASAMSEYYDSGAREVKILNIEIVEQYEFADFAVYDELKEKYEYITIEEFNAISNATVVKIEFDLTTAGETVTLDQELTCIELDNKWYVLEDGAYTN